jgi:creatinine amidohydrolase
MSHPWRLKEMTPDECRTRLQTFRRLIVPAGTLEFRAPHLPLGADTLIAERLADDLSARTGVPRAPAVEFGVHARSDRTSPGVASVSRKTLHRLMNELIASWEVGAGVREVIILTAHAVEGHQEALSTIRATGDVRVVDIFGFNFDGLLTDPLGPLHGGELDTSLILHLCPGLIRDVGVVARTRATAERGARLYQFILERIATRWFA